MAATLLFGAAAAAFAGGVGGIAAAWFARAFDRRKAAVEMLSSDRTERLLICMRWMATPLRPLAARLLRVRAVDDAASDALRLIGDDGACAKDVLVSAVISAASAAGLLAGILTGSAVCGAAVAGVSVAGFFIFASNRAEKHAAAMREEVPDALRSMSTCFRSGLSLVQTLQETAAECGRGLGRVFDAAARRLVLGATPTEALSVMRDVKGVPELAFVAVALDVQHQSGGSIAPVLESARESVDSELELARSLRVQTAQAKLSACIVTIMPFILIAAFSLMSPDFLKPFFQSFAGMALLALAIVMQLAGVLIVRRMLKIDAG